VVDVGGAMPTRDAASYVIGLGLMQALAHAAPDVPESRYPELGQRYRHHYLAHQNDISLFDGVLPLLADLRQRGHLITVATGKSRRGLDEALHAVELRGVFHGSRTADETAGKPDPLMLLVDEDLRIGVVTGHIGLHEVCKKITVARLKHKIKIFYQTLEEDFGIPQPKIAVLGIHPHAGEEGLIGTEDRDIVAPVIREIFEKEGKLIFGPFAADGFFGFGNFKNFDGILAMYHDQGLIPFKLLSDGNGVNFTAGLSIVRTSPVHGTAYNIAGKGIARHQSMRQAIELGAKIFQQRRQNQYLKENRLKPFKGERERNS
jgi:hypothetical protein